MTTPDTTVTKSQDHWFKRIIESTRLIRSGKAYDRTVGPDSGWIGMNRKTGNRIQIEMSEFAARKYQVVLSKDEAIHLRDSLSSLIDEQIATQ